MVNSSNKWKIICFNAKTSLQRQSLIHAAFYPVGKTHMAITTQDILRQMRGWHSQQQVLKRTKAIRRSKSLVTSVRKLVTIQTNVKKMMRLLRHLTKRAQIS